ncbi:putative acrosin [Iris pallida]|uniref:Acrosin n=1 Tax=Iris pallida TaxID=29817 RepID=A0AAX6DXM7_IRIPA|nr:putative acrosin [Iris pallida]
MATKSITSLLLLSVFLLSTSLVLSSRREDERDESNPYVFGGESFIHRARTQHGSIRVLRNFLQKSSLLMGIANYRLAMFEANPRTFAVPKQSDAEQIFFVTQGEGTVTLLRNEESRDQSHNIKRESHNIRKGDIIRVQAGTVFYIINNSNNQKLQIVMLVQPVSVPGQFEDLYIGGGDKPESVWRTFSTRILEAALNTQQEKLERLFGQQKEGEIIQASEEQIRGLSGQPSTEGRQPFNLLEKRPDRSNERGQLYIANFEDYEELRDLDVHVTFTNIARGSMMAPFYESKATEIMIVSDGRGEFEMVSPHLSSQNQSQCRRGQWGEESKEEEEGRCRYQKVKSSLTQGTVFIIPAGHPTAIIASEEQNLQVVCFKVHARNSRKVFLAGRNNVVNEMEKEAKELSARAPRRRASSHRRRAPWPAPPTIFLLRPPPSPPPPSSGSSSFSTFSSSSFLSTQVAPASSRGMEKEAKELSFGVPSKLVENVFGGSKDEVFVRGPEQTQPGMKAFWEFAGF